MADKDLRRTPHGRAEDFWWYEDPEGIEACIEAYNEEGGLSVKCRRISWRSIRAALARKDK